MAPFWTASITLSATPSTALWPKPTQMESSGPSAAKPGAAWAAAMTGAKFRSAMWVTPGQATRPVVKIRLK